MRHGSFVRKSAAAGADCGTRPGLHGQTLVSSGHADLDRILGGGLPLGSLLLLLEDGWSAHHATLLRYFLGEGAACGQSVLLAAAPAPAGGLPRFIPAQAKAGPTDKDDAAQAAGQDGEEFKLRIAWQYRRYIKADPPHGGAAAPATGSGGSGSSSGSGGGRAGGSSASRRAVGLRDWCHQFDLLKAAGGEGLQQCRGELLDCSSRSNGCASSCSSSPAGTQQLLHAAAQFVLSLAPTEAVQPSSGMAAASTVPARAQPLPAGPQHVGRIAVLSLGSLGWQLAEGSSALGSGSSGSGGHGSPHGGFGGLAVLRALLRLKGLVRGQRCAAVATVPAALFSPSDLARMQHAADAVIALESVADDSDIVRLAPDSASVAGLLHVRKLPSLGTMAPPVPEAALHLLRHKRRRLAITAVQIDPEAEQADAEAASSAGLSAASVLCGGPPRAGSAIDF